MKQNPSVCIIFYQHLFSWYHSMLFLHSSESICSHWVPDKDLEVTAASCEKNTKAAKHLLRGRCRGILEWSSWFSQDHSPQRHRHRAVGALIGRYWLCLLRINITKISRCQVNTFLSTALLKSLNRLTKMWHVVDMINAILLFFCIICKWS